MNWQTIPSILLTSQVLVSILGVILVYKCLQYYVTKASKRSSQLSKAGLGRRLSAAEAFLDISSLKKHGLFNICLILTLRSKEKLSKDYVRDALVLLAKRQPMLRAVISTIPSSSTFARDRYFTIIDGCEMVDMIDLSCSMVKAREWHDVWHDIASKQRGNGLLWRAVLLQEEFLREKENYANTLIVSFSHSAVDGVSAVKFGNQFVKYLNEVAAGVHSVDDDISSLTLSPTVDDLITNTHGWSVWKFIIRSFCIGPILIFIFKKLIRYKLLYSKPPNPFLAQYPPKQLPTQSQITYKVFSEKETANIIKFCKANKSTVTGALMAAAHLAFCKLLHEGPNQKNLKLEHSFAVNAQRNCVPKPHKDYLGYFATVVSSMPMQYINAEQAKLSTVAQEATKLIRSLVEKETHVTESVIGTDVLSLEDLEQILFPLDPELSVKITACNFISSAGSFDFRKEQEHYTYALHECFFDNLNHGGPDIFFHFNVTVNGKMSWVIMYDISKVSPELAEIFANDCFSKFDEIAEQGQEKVDMHPM